MVITYDEYMKRKKKKQKEASNDGVISLEKYAEINDMDLTTLRRGSSSPKEDTGTMPVAGEQKKRTWFQKSEGNLGETIAGSGTDLLTNATGGLLGMGETILDALIALGPYAQQYQMTGGADGLPLSIDQQKVVDETRKSAQKYAAEIVQKDLYDEQKIAKALISDNVKKHTGIDSETMSVFGEKSDALAQSGGQLIGQLGVNALLPGAGLASMGMSAFGGEMENALNSGATYEEAVTSSTISAGAEVVTEKLFGYFGTKGLDDIISKGLANKISNATVRTLAKVGVDAAGEGAEEVLSGVASAIGQKLTYMEEKEINELFSNEDALESFIGGAVLGSIGSGANAVKSKVTGKDMVTELTKNEEAVVEAIAKERMKEHEPKLGQVTAEKDAKKQMQQYRNEAREMLKNGDVSVDEIEKALGGDTLKKYNDSVNLLEEYNKLNRTKSSELTGEQADRLAELKEQVNNGTLSEENNRKLKQQISEQVNRLTQNDQFIRASYNEKAKRSQTYEADLSQYDEKAQSTIQKAIDSGILNNTKKTHAFVDMIAKLSADKGVSFDFTNNQKLKESGFALDGKTVNGFIQDGNISLNINSAKALNKVVGHEITHVLEGTELYDQLQDTIIKYAQNKGDYDARWESIVKLYRKQFEGQMSEERMQQYKAELTADLVGDYLFSDPDFINNLSVEQPNIFKKIYDEIKYMVKVATAGSKEEKQLLEVKKAFDKAYKENGSKKAQETPQYHVSDTFSEEIDKTLDGTMNKSSLVKARDYTPRMLVEYGVADLPMLITQNHVKSIIYTEEQAKNLGLKINDKINYHGLGKDLLVKAVDSLDAPLEIYKKSEDDFIIVTELQDGNGNTIIAPIRINGKGSYNNVYLDENHILSVYGKKNLENYLERNNFEKIYVKKETTLNERGQSPNISDSFVNSISQNAENTTENVKFSISDDDYQSVVDSGDMELAQNMVDEAAKANGYTVKAYHGTGRADRVGNVFRPDRATSGPMAFFTDNREIASNYARDKKDTSIAYDEEYDSYYTQFRVNRNGKSISIPELWKYLSVSERNEIKEKAKHVKFDDDYETIIVDPTEEHGNGAWDEYALREHKGNALEALVDTWLETGDLYEQESSFLEVLELVGIKDAEYRDPEARYEKVYDTWLKIENPFNTANVDKSFYDNLKEWIESNDMSPYEKASQHADMWDKNNQTPESWLEKLADDIENDLTHAWTVIPDFVTDYLKEQGFDGIQDTGGKQGGEGHTVWIPFSSEQVKSADAITYDDNGNVIPLSERFKENKTDIRYSISSSDNAPIDSKLTYGSDIALDIPIRSDIAPVQDAMDDIPIREDITPPVQPETVQAEEATMLPEEKWLEQKLNRIEKHLARDIEELNAEYNERLKDAMSQQMRESIETERLHRIDELEVEAEKERARARDSAEKINRKELHESIINGIKTAFAKMGFDFDKVLVNAKNKSTFSSVDNTPQRFMEKSLGYKEGQILADMTINKTALNESKAVAWLDSYTNRKNGVLAQIVKEYGIQPRSKESAAAQMYGEGFYVNKKNEYVRYGDAELAKDFPNVDTQEKIKRLAKDERIRQIYDETLEAINASRRRNGYPEIPRRKDYFLHFQAMTDKFSTLGIPFNPNDIRAKDLPTDLNGVTADLKPGQPYFASANQRKGIRTTYDLLGGLEQYLTSAKNQIYHIDDIQTFRALRNYVADTFGQAHGFDDLDELSEAEIEERIKDIKNSHLSVFAKFLNEQANIMAGKTAMIDRGFEGVFGRRAITFMKDLNSQVGSNMVGYNVSSSLTNLISMVQGFAKANKAAAMKALVQTVSNKMNGIRGRSDGFLEVDPLYIRRTGADKFTRTLWEKAKEPGYLLAGAVDSISTEFLVRCKYNELTQKGMDDTKAHIEADKWASRILGDRTYGQMPQLYNSQVLGLVTKFQLEVRNQLDSMFYDTIQEKTLETEQIQDELNRNRTRAAQIASTFTQLAVFQHLFGQAFETMAGYNPTFDIIEVAMTMFGWDDEEESEDTFTDNLNQGFQMLLEDLPYTSTFTGGRIPIASALPVGELLTGKNEYGNEKSRVETLLETLPYYALPGGYGQIKKTVQGLSMFEDDLPIVGSYTKNGLIDKVKGESPGNLRFSVEDDIPTRLQAAVFGQYASENARDYFDNGRSPLTEKQTRELVMLDIPIKRYWDYRQGLKKIEADKDENGNSIPGSKKQKTIEYIDSLDVDLEEKMILFKFQYPSDDTYNYQILDYLKGRTDISDSEKKNILKDMGFTVEGNNVTWD